MKLALFWILGTTVAYAFQVGRFQKAVRTPYLFALPEAELHFERAVECGENYGLCSVEELLDLADELESFQDQAFYEDNEALQDREVKDRKDLAEILRMEAKLAIRHDYLKKANLFKSDVDEAHDMRNRDDAMDAIMDFVE